MSKTPLVILVGADKGGVGKTTVARALADYLAARLAAAKLFDAEYPAGELKKFADAEAVDLDAVAGQMRVFDSVAGVTVVDIRAGLLSKTLRALDEVKLLDDVRAGALHLALLHVIEPTDRSLGEVSAMAAMIGGGSRHFLVKNHINNADFSAWEAGSRFSEQLRQMQSATILVPHLKDEAYQRVEKLSASFAGFAADASQSRVLRGYVRAWLDAICADFDKVGLPALIDGAVKE